MVKDFGNGTYRGTGIPVDRLLVHGYGRAEPLNVFNPRFFGLTQKLPRIG